MDILLLGRDGQVGWELGTALSPLGRIIAPGLDEANFENLDGLRRLVDRLQPAIIVNAAAYTAVDQAETDFDRAQRCNAEAPAMLAAATKELGSWLIHYSTDYVFDGTKTTAYDEEDTANPLSVYGRTKLAGDEAVAQSGCRFLTFRTSWVFADRGRNFARTILRLAQERDALSIVADQIGAPTSAELLASATALALQQVVQDPDGQKKSGLYNLVAAGETSWHGYALYLLKQAKQMGWPIKIPLEKVLPLTTAEYPLPAKRPANSRLALEKIQRVFGITPPDWTHHTNRLLTVWTEARSAA